MSTPDTALHAARTSVLAAFRDVGARRWIRVTGASMRPLVPGGSWLLVDFGAARPRVGDIVLAVTGGRSVAHRVVAAPTPSRGERYVVKGDAEAVADRRLAPGEILGVVVAVRRPDGRTTSLGCRGPLARALGMTSRWTSHAGRAGIVAARHLPRPIGAPIAAVLAFAARASIFMLAISALAWASIESRWKGGDSHGEV